MGTKHIILLISFFYLSSFAQKKYTVIYEVYPTFGSIEKSEDNDEKGFAFIFEGVDNAIREIKYKMEYNNNESCFKIIDIIPENTKSYRLAKSYSGNEEFYCNKNLEYKVKIKNFLGNRFYIKDTSKYDWKIFNEIKIIDGKQCYKATAIKRIKIHSETKEYEITAWFCKDFPGYFGPKGYNGLPGLILELIDDKITFIAKKIEISNSSIENNIENKKIITEIEYNEIVKNKSNNIFEN